MDTPPPVLLLDVDGVLFADRPPWNDADKRAVITVGTEDYPVRWSPQCVSTLFKLAHNGRIEIRWCTTWCPHAHLLEQLWQLPPLPRCWADPIDSIPQVKAAKLAAARAVLAADRRLIWCDDDAIPLAKKRRELGMAGDALYVIPNGVRGLSPGQMRQIAAFVGE